MVLLETIPAGGVCAEENKLVLKGGEWHDVRGKGCYYPAGFGALRLVSICFANCRTGRSHHDPLTANTKKAPEGAFFVFGGEREIRTLERLPVTRFPSVRLRPLGQLTFEGAHHNTRFIGCQSCWGRYFSLLAV